MVQVRKAVFPIARFGVDFLPASVSVPKELFPIIDRPILQHAVEEARAAGCTHFIFVTAPGRSLVENHFDRNADAERLLEELGRTEALAALRAASIPSGRAAFIRQHEIRGLGHAVLCAREYLGDEPFAVVLADDLMLSRTPVLKQMTDRYERVGGQLIAGIEVIREQVGRYGIMRIVDTGGNVVDVTEIAEKPNSDTMSSNFAVSGRYILTPEIFGALESVATDATGRLQLTDAISSLIGRTKVSGLRFEGERFDCGTVAGFVKATIAFALERAEVAAEITPYMRRVLERMGRED